MIYLRVVLKVACSFILLFSFCSYSADEDQSNEEIQQLAEDFTLNMLMSNPPDVGEYLVTANNIDSRLQFSHCSEPLMASIPGKQTLTSTVSVLVRCEIKDWQVYVPVKIQLMTPLVVAVRALGKGVTLSRSDLNIEMLDSRLQRGATYNEIQLLVGAKLKRALNIKQVISSKDLCMVCQNDMITLKAGTENMSIMTKGLAMNDGIIGEQVRVKNMKSNKIVVGVVSRVGEVEVPF